MVADIGGDVSEEKEKARLDMEEKTHSETGARVVSRGVDTLVVNAFYTDLGKPVKRELDESLAEQFDEWKRVAQAEHQEVATTLVFREARLLMQPNGAGRGQWPWLLKTKDITLSISRGQWNGIASVRLNAVYLWSCVSLKEALSQVRTFLESVFGSEMYLQVSAVDLCADIAGWTDVESLDKATHFVSRSRKRSVYATPDWGQDAVVHDYSYGLRQTGLDFSRGSAVSCTIYNKSREMQQSGKEWFEDLWRVRGWSEDDGVVWRVEMKYRREALHELTQDEAFHGIEDASELPARLGLLWAYGVGRVGGDEDGVPDGWIRCVVPTEDRNRSRWPTHPVWMVVQKAFTEVCEVPEQFGKVVRKRWRERNSEKAIEAIMGYLTSVAAWEGEAFADAETDLSIVLHWLADKGDEYLRRKGWDFGAEIQRKRVKMSLQV